MRRRLKRTGAVLPLTLVVLLVGIAFSAVVLVMVENYFSTSTSLVREIDITGEAEGGLEAGKQWLIGLSGPTTGCRDSPPMTPRT